MRKVRLGDDRSADASTAYSLLTASRRTIQLTPGILGCNACCCVSTFCVASLAVFSVTTFGLAW